MGRGVRRRRRKRGLVKRMTREEMACGPYYSYRIVYDLKPGDIFRFIHRHKTVDCHKAVLRERSRNWSIDNRLDFPKGSIIIWTGEWWLTSLGPFKPTNWWWSSYVVHVEPVAISVPKRVRLKLWKQPSKPKVAFKQNTEQLKIPQTGILNTVKTFFGL